MADGGENIAKGAVNGITGLIQKLGTDGISPIVANLEKYTQYLVGMVKPLADIQKSMIDMAKSAGLASASIMASAKGFIAANRDLSLSINYGVSTQELLGLQQKTMRSIGRNIQISRTERPIVENGEVVGKYDSEIELMAAARTAFGDETVAKIAAGFDKLGKSMGAAAKETGKLYEEAGRYGLNLEQYADNFISNLSMAQNFSFKKGVDGLKEMARKATEVRQDMQQVAQFAEKVNNVEGAIETAANLQVLGGSFAALASPLNLLHDSLVDMNSLQDTMLNMTKGAAFYDQTTHQIDMDQFTRMRLQAAARSIGLDPNKFIDQAYAQARGDEIEKQLRQNGSADEDVIALLRNVGQINSETGEAGATIGGDFYSASEIAQSEQLQNQLIMENRSQTDDIKAIAKSVLSIEEQMTGRKYQLVNELAYNKMQPGILGRKSAWEEATGFVEQKLTPEFYSALGRIGLAQDAVIPIYAGIMGGITDLTQTLNANSPEEFGQKLGDTIQGMLPDNWGVDVRDSVAAIGTSVGKLFEGFSQWFEKNDIHVNPLAPAEVPKIGESNGTQPPVASAAGSGSGSGGSGVSPGSSSSSSAPTIERGRTTSEPPQPNSTTFTTSERSVPRSETVQSTTATYLGTDAAGTPEYNINVGGQFTMVVKSESGTDLTKINIDNLVREWIRQNPDEIIRMFNQATANAERVGVSQNNI